MNGEITARNHGIGRIEGRESSSKNRAVRFFEEERNGAPAGISRNVSGTSPEVRSTRIRLDLGRSCAGTTGRGLDAFNPACFRGSGRQDVNRTTIPDDGPSVY